MWLAYLLVGELLHGEKAWQSSNQYLRRAVALLEKSRTSDEIPSLAQLTPQQYQSLVLDVRRTIGINAYHQKDYGTAIEVFEMIATDETVPDGVILNAEEWEQSVSGHKTVFNFILRINDGFVLWCFWDPSRSTQPTRTHFFFQTHVK